MDAPRHRWGATPGLHPDALAAVATLRGLSPAPARAARILLIGLPDPGDLLPLAAYLPEATLVGVESSGARLEVSAAFVRELGLTNVTLQGGATAEGVAGLGTFDYVLSRDELARQDASGRERLLHACAGALTPRGLLALGYPAHPGWRAAHDLSSWIERQLGPRGSGEPGDRVARARSLLGRLAGMTSSPEGPLGGLSAFAATASLLSDEELRDRIVDRRLSPLGLAEVADVAAKAGLRYLGDACRTLAGAQLVERLARSLAPEVDALTEVEALADLAMPRPWRLSVLTGAPPSPTPEAALLELDLRSLAVALRPDAERLELAAEAETFVGPGDVRLEVEGRLLRVLLRVAADVWPQAMPVVLAVERSAELIASADPRWAIEVNLPALRQAKERLLELCAMGLVDLRTAPLPCALEIDARPRVHDLARHQAGRCATVTSPLHQDIEPEPLLRALIQTLDGSREAPAVEQEMRSRHERGEFEIAVDGEHPADELGLTCVLRSQILEGLRRLRALGLLALQAGASGREV
jgi:SAM-dependent methyltransferase